MARIAKLMWLVVPVVAAGALLDCATSRPRTDVLEAFVARNNADRAARRRDEVAWGEMHDGRAADAYADAVRQCETLYKEAAELLVRGRDMSDEEFAFDNQTLLLRSAWISVLEQLSLGAHAEDLSDEPGMWPAMFGIEAIVACELRLRLLERRELDAVHLLLDVLMVNTDRAFVDANFQWASGGIRDVFDSWKEQGVVLEDAANRAALERGLRVIERRWDRYHEVADCVAMWADMIVRDDYPWKEWTFDEHLDAWEFAFRPREHLRAYVEHVVRAESLWRSPTGLDDAMTVCRSLRPRYIDLMAWAKAVEKERLETLQRIREVIAELQ